jgi:hypothetical protein
MDDHVEPNSPEFQSQKAMPHNRNSGRDAAAGGPARTLRAVDLDGRDAVPDRLVAAIVQTLGREPSATEWLQIVAHHREMGRRIGELLAAQTTVPNPDS